MSWEVPFIVDGSKVKITQLSDEEVEKLGVKNQEIGTYKKPTEPFGQATVEFAASADKPARTVLTLALRGAGATLEIVSTPPIPSPTVHQPMSAIG